MFPPFDQEKALAVCRSMISAFESGRLLLPQVTFPSAERAGSGLMAGALVCSASDGSEVVLKTVSGLSRCLQEPGRKAAAEEAVRCTDGSILVPPVVTAGSRDAALRENDAEIHALTARIDALSCGAEGGDVAEEKRRLRMQRTELCTRSLARIHALYAFHCADGRLRTLSDICAVRGVRLPPTGTGECCAPKLLDWAFSHALQPLSMCEVYYGRDTQHKSSGRQYEPCDERCGILLPAMLGLEILYRDEHIIVVNKQSGVLSVPGRVEKDCIVSRVRRLFPGCIEQPAVHRLDMETSGLLVLAFTKEAHRGLCRQFEEGAVQKEYEALLDGVLPAKHIPGHGTTELYFRVDLDNRPHQIWDTVRGKKAVTEWQVLRVETYHAPAFTDSCGEKHVDRDGRPVTRVLFIPHTGRTHQLRLASADNHGFGVPIVGDTLYGRCDPGERLMLHARRLCFTHPATGRRMEFECAAPF